MRSKGALGRCATRLVTGIKRERGEGRGRERGRERWSLTREGGIVESEGGIERERGIVEREGGIERKEGRPATAPADALARRFRALRHQRGHGDRHETPRGYLVWALT